ncbi:exosortase system-associated protein, TIGR04073 family [bacterium]|nr:exosortase system-associated protein, TIGR04073 family [bacterium]
MRRLSHRSRSLAFCLILVGLVFCATSGVVQAQMETATTLKDVGVRSYTYDESTIVPTVIPGPVVDASRVLSKHRARTGSPLRDLWVFPKMTRKLWRGAHNVLFGWVELPKNIIVDTIQTDPFTGLITGVAVGTMRTIERTGIGAIEIVTFWHEWPENYSPAVKPEWVLEDFAE